LRYNQSKSYIRGNDNRSLNLERYGTWFGITSALSHYEFDRFGGMLRARLSNFNQNSYFRITKENSLEALYRLNTNKYFLDAGVTSVKSVSVDDNYYGSDPINEDVTQRRNYYDIALEKKPQRIGHSAFSYSLFTELYSSTYDSKYLVRPSEYSSVYREKEFSASVFTRDFKLAPRVFAATRADWRFFTYHYKYTNQGNYNYDGSSRVESAYGSAEIRWRFSNKGVLGTDYLWERQQSNGSYSWAPFVSYSPARKINLRLSAHYMPENTFTYNNRIDFPRTIFGETFDISWKLGRTDNLTASFDIDNAIAGTSLYNLSYNATRRFGDISFSVLKHPEINYDYTNRGMYIYSLGVYFR
jgi:hypothetical protein